MSATDLAIDLPHGTADVLDMSEAELPDAISALIQRREFSGLVAQIHLDLRSSDAARRTRGECALRKLGFPV